MRSAIALGAGAARRRAPAANGLPAQRPAPRARRRARSCARRPPATTASWRSPAPWRATSTPQARWETRLRVCHPGVDLERFSGPPTAAEPRTGAAAGRDRGLEAPGPRARGGRHRRPRAARAAPARGGRAARRARRGAAPRPARAGAEQPGPLGARGAERARWTPPTPCATRPACSTARTASRSGWWCSRRSPRDGRWSRPPPAGPRSCSTTAWGGSTRRATPQAAAARLVEVLGTRTSPSRLGQEGRRRAEARYGLESAGARWREAVAPPARAPRGRVAREGLALVTVTHDSELELARAPALRGAPPARGPRGGRGLGLERRERGGGARLRRAGQRARARRERGLRHGEQSRRGGGERAGGGAREPRRGAAGRLAGGAGERGGATRPARADRGAARAPARRQSPGLRAPAAGHGGRPRPLAGASGRSSRSARPAARALAIAAAAPRGLGGGLLPRGAHGDAAPARAVRRAHLPLRRGPRPRSARRRRRGRDLVLARRAGAPQAGAQLGARLRWRALRAARARAPPGDRAPARRARRAARRRGPARHVRHPVRPAGRFCGDPRNGSAVQLDTINRLRRQPFA